ncbi:hypothetical protein Q5P01_021474 [Channa striata]|uniref:Arginine vasopressin-induced protein 1 n=1 Tax=Channa striata TaxID=64152 RepID=A0AA88LU95_CHASR|nr:hypothetical protein Q5P01_021474 [Channa striata]
MKAAAEEDAIAEGSCGHQSILGLEPVYVAFPCVPPDGFRTYQPSLFHGGGLLFALQRLFRAAGDQDAEQRAQLVWGHRDEGELAQALIGLKAQSHRRGLRRNGRDALGSHWLRAFNHLRIRENSPTHQGKDVVEENDAEAAARSSPEPHRHTPVGTTGRGATVVLSDSQKPAGTPERPVRAGSGLRRGGENNPERYLHRILH